MTSLYQPRTGQVATPETEAGESYYDYSRIDNPQARQVAQQVAQQIRPILRRTAVNAWTVGNMANQVKAVLPHGQFVEWAEAEFGPEQPGVQLSVRSLQRWMGLAATVPLALVETSGMSLAGLLEASAPSTPPEVRAQALSEAEAGNPPSKADVVKLKQAASVGPGSGGGRRVTVGMGNDEDKATVRRPLPPHGYSKWDGHRCPNCKKTDGRKWFGSQWQDPAIAEKQKILNDLDDQWVEAGRPGSCPSVGHPISIEIRDNWSRFCVGECQCGVRFWHDFAGGTSEKWHYYTREPAAEPQDPAFHSDLVTITLKESVAWVLLAYLQGDTELKHYDRDAIVRVLLDVLAEDD